jgi:3-ketosteroid 9alpha-monooxygenase subunit B
MQLSHDHEYHSLTIAEVIDETADTRSFVLDIPSELAETFAYQAGQFCTFRAVVDDHEVVRCYSMSSSPDADEVFKTAVKRVPTGVMSNWMNDTLAPGDTIDVLRPAGLFVLHPNETPIVAFAGGSGITPVISIIKSALLTTKREIVLVYANRDASSVIYGDELEQLRAGSDGRLTIHQHLDDERGFLDAAACAALVGDRTDGDFYICGPGPYMDIVEAGIEQLGVSRRQVFIERFVISGDLSSFAEQSATDSLVIKLGGRKQTVDYKMGDTILDTARRAGLKPPFSCESGSCATCMAHLDAGAATMRVNNALTPDEVDDGWVLTCQSIPTSREVVVNYDA